MAHKRRVKRRYRRKKAARGRAVHIGALRARGSAISRKQERRARRRRRGGVDPRSTYEWRIPANPVGRRTKRVLMRVRLGWLARMFD